LDVIKETSRITLNSYELELGTGSIYSDNLKIEQIPSACAFDTTAQRAVFTLPNALPAGSKAKFKIGFHGKLTGNMMGYYKSIWEQDGKTKAYALTQFEVSNVIDHVGTMASDLGQLAHCSQAGVPVLG
jgi:aminopeptidase 2